MSEFSPEQEKAIATYGTLGPNRNEDAVAEIVGVNRRTLWVWRQEPRFCEAIRQEARRNFVRQYGDVVDALIRKAKKGHVAAAKLLMEFDGALVQRHEVEEKGQAAYREIVERAGLEANKMRLRADEMRLEGLKAMGLTEATAGKVIEALERQGLPKALFSEVIAKAP